jgi:hypothetical protein
MYNPVDVEDGNFIDALSLYRVNDSYGMFFSDTKGIKTKQVQITFENDFSSASISVNITVRSGGYSALAIFFIIVSVLALLGIIIILVRRHLKREEMQSDFQEELMRRSGASLAQSGYSPEN